MRRKDNAIKVTATANKGKKNLVFTHTKARKKRKKPIKRFSESDDRLGVLPWLSCIRKRKK